MRSAYAPQDTNQLIRAAPADYVPSEDSARLRLWVAASSTLRFVTGDRVVCNLGKHGPRKGLITAVKSRQPSGRMAAYAVKLDEPLGDPGTHQFLHTVYRKSRRVQH